jgi:hypothetical protein
MSHELEHLADGTTAFATARVPAWHQLGTLTTDAMTAAEVITMARLGGWNVRKIPVVGRHLVGDAVTGARYDTIDAPDKSMTVRTNPVTGGTDYLGVVGRDYTPVQNEACAELLDLLVDASGGHFETAGLRRVGGGPRHLAGPRPPRGPHHGRHRDQPDRSSAAGRHSRRLRRTSPQVRALDGLPRCEFL